MFSVNKEETLRDSEKLWSQVCLHRVKEVGLEKICSGQDFNICPKVVGLTVMLPSTGSITAGCDVERESEFINQNPGWNISEILWIYVRTHVGKSREKAVGGKTGRTICLSIFKWTNQICHCQLEDSY